MKENTLNKIERLDTYKYIGSYTGVEFPFLKKDNNYQIEFISSRAIRIYHTINNYQRFNDVSIEVLYKCFKKVSSKLYHGDEILKMIREGELKEGDIYIRFECKNGDNVLPKMTFRVGLNETSPSFSSLIKHKFTIKEKEYLTFDEARKTGRNFKYKEWDEFRNLNDVLLEISKYGNGSINTILDEKSWEVED